MNTLSISRTWKGQHMLFVQMYNRLPSLIGPIYPTITFRYSKLQFSNQFMYLLKAIVVV